MILKTASGKELHSIGIGTWGICSKITDEDNDYRGVAPDKGNEDSEIAAIRFSLDQGQNHIDCAELYGGFYTDEVVGAAIEGYNRKDLFIADKLWRISVGKGKVRSTVEEMLKKLGTDYLDMLYIHAPWEDIEWEEAIPQIDELIDEGVVRHFAVSNFTVEDMKKANSIAQNPIAANQMNYNVLHTGEVNVDFKKYCRDNEIAIIAYQPIKRGEVFENETIRSIASKHGVTASQVALAWLLHNDMLPIPKTTNKDHIIDNLSSTDLKLSHEDIELLSTLD